MLHLSGCLSLIKHGFSDCRIELKSQPPSTPPQMSESQRTWRLTCGLQTFMSRVWLKLQPMWELFSEFSRPNRKERADLEAKRTRGVAFSPQLQPRYWWRRWKRRCHRVGVGGLPIRICLHGDLLVLFSQRRGSQVWSRLFSSKDAQAPSDWAFGQTPAVFFF